LALEARGTGDAVDRAQDRVDLKLIRRDLVVGSTARIGGLANQAV